MSATREYFHDPSYLGPRSTQSKYFHDPSSLGQGSEMYIHRLWCWCKRVQDLGCALPRSIVWNSTTWVASMVLLPIC
jgi:hypothetical protein